MLCLKTQVYDLKDDDLTNSPSIEISTMVPSLAKLDADAASGGLEYFETCIFFENGSKVVGNYDSPRVALSGHREWVGDVVENFYTWLHGGEGLL